MYNSRFLMYIEETPSSQPSWAGGGRLLVFIALLVRVLAGAMAESYLDGVVTRVVIERVVHSGASLVSAIGACQYRLRLYLHHSHQGLHIYFLLHIFFSILNSKILNS